MTEYAVFTHITVLCSVLVFIYAVVGFLGESLANACSIGAEKAVLKGLFTKIESNKNQQYLVFICTSSRCFLQFQAFCFDTKKRPVLRCQPSTSLRSHQVQQEGLSISVRTVQPAKVHSFHSTKRLALSPGLFMLGVMSNGQNLYFTSNFLFKGAFTLDFYGGGSKHLHFKGLQEKNK